MTAIVVEERCQDFGRPGCLLAPDSRFDMSFEDIGEGTLRFCSHCGPIAHELDKMLTVLLEDPEKAEKLRELLDAAEEKLKTQMV